ncbi:hypothetical protein BD413DRAFT_13368 [Trametes elegans]|nr:hypothetical protein BD413DRAFT_13368 [Trametes elegans]
MAEHTYKFNVKMTCSGCSNAVDRVLKKAEGALRMHCTRENGALSEDARRRRHLRVRREPGEAGSGGQGHDPVRRPAREDREDGQAGASSAARADPCGLSGHSLLMVHAARSFLERPWCDRRRVDVWLTMSLCTIRTAGCRRDGNRPDALESMSSFNC